MFSVPLSLTGSKLLIYSSALYVIWGVTYTMMDIPYWSLIPAITSHGKEREQLSVIARSCAGLGFALPVGLTMVLVPLLGSGSEHAGFGKLSIIIAIFFVVAILITVLNVKEKEKPLSKSPTIKEMFHSLITNDQALIVVIAIVMFNSSLYITQQLAIYYFKYDLGNAALFGIFGTVGGLAQILSMALVPLFRRKFGIKKLLTIAICVTLVGYTMLFIFGMLSIRSMVLLALAAVIIFMGFGIATVLTTIFLADTVDYGEWKNKRRTESVIFSLQTFVVKLGSAISVLVAGVGIDLIKLDVNASTQTATTLLGLRSIMILLPMVGLILTILYFRKRYTLDEAKLDQITSDLKARNPQ
jgi:melibiose permease